MNQMKEEITSRTLIINGKIIKDPENGIKWTKLREENRKRFELAQKRAG